jgi:UDP-N-acetylmuramoyl-L-alanyl-D-glutamate--2,6-diaminopimelate ligase
MMQRRTLVELLTDCPVQAVHGSQDLAVSGLAFHTRDVVEGSLFFALRGAAVDGHSFLADAVAGGASAVVVEEVSDLPKQITQVVVADSRIALGRCSAVWFDHPTQQLRCVGITGTNGKTTLTFLLEAIWRAAGRSPGVLGTINYRHGSMKMEAPTTTPESYDLQKICRAMCDHGATDVAMEVSSHALVQQRVEGAQFVGGVFTNLSQDHLDYHHDMETYGAAKRQLFALVARQPDGFAIINADDPASQSMIDQLPLRVISYGMQPAAHVHPIAWDSTVDGLHAEISLCDATLRMRSSLIGQFNLLNVLAAMGAAEAMGVSQDAIVEGIAAVQSIPGRLERVDGPHGVTVLVDYAHTPDALNNVLRTLRPLTQGRLITVFGCGGDRDHAKRPLMGAVVDQLGDMAFVTSDNPRTEDPHAIIKQIVAGMRAECEPDTRVVDVDRRNAIHRALDMARAGDVLLVAGKGHEDYQIVGRRRHHFDDREVIREGC